MKRIKIVVSLLVLVALPFCFISCASTGSSKLSKSMVEGIIEGKTTKDEIASKFGHPEQMMNFDKKGLDDYMYRVFLKRPPEDMFPEDKYEVWTYSKWSYVASPIPFTSHETQKNCMFMINSNDICVKKFYGEKGKFGF